MAAARLGFRRLFSVSAFAPPPSAAARPAAEPSTNLFVSGLNKRTTSETLREAFAKFGQVVDARVIADRVSGYSRGFGFVRYASIEEAEAGIKSMDGKPLYNATPFDDNVFSPVNAVVSYDSFNACDVKESFLDGWVIFAEYARPREAPQPPPPQATAASASAYQ